MLIVKPTIEGSVRTGDERTKKPASQDLARDPIQHLPENRGSCTGKAKQVSPPGRPRK